MVNGIIDLRKAVDAEHDAAVADIHDTIIALDNELRDHLRYVLAGSIRSRLMGVVLLGTRLVLEIASGILGAV